MFQLQLRDNNDTLVAYIHNKVKTIAWDWNRIGGCGSCSIQLIEPFDGVLAGSLQEDYSIRAYLSGTLWYSGYIDRVSPNVTGKSETINVLALGYVNQLKRMVVSKKTYETTETSAIVRNIAEVYATAHTDVLSSAENYEDSFFTPDTVYFNESAFDAISKLADIAGKREWGVDASRNLFFKKRDDSIQHNFNIKEDFSSFKPIKDYNPIVTRIYFEGADDYAETFTITNRVTLREKVVSNSAIKTKQVAYQFARMYLKEHGVARRSYVGKQINRTTRVESTIPIGRATISTKIFLRQYYDVASQLYDTGLKYDGGNEDFQINKIHYELKDEGVVATLYLGPLPPDIVDSLARLQYEISTERIKT